jgi:flagellar biosynthesis/type III secretory pathway protein FliH
MDGDFISHALDKPNWIRQGGRARPSDVGLSSSAALFLQRDLNDEALHKAAEPVIGRAELAATRQEGFDAGYSAGLAAAAGTQAAYRTAAEVHTLEGITAALQDGCRQAANVADSAAAALARALIEAMRAVMPDLIRHTAVNETRAMLAHILPGLSREAVVHIEVPPEIGRYVETMLAPLAVEQRDKIRVIAKDGMRPGETRVHWASGHARRQPAQIWQTVMEALQPALDDPKSEDSDNGE